MKIIPINK